MKQLHDQDKSPLNIKYWHLKLNLWCQSNEINYLRRSPFQNVINGCPFPPFLGRRFLVLEGVLLIETVKKQRVGDFRVQHNVQCMSRFRRIFTKYFPTTEQKSFWRAPSQMNWEFLRSSQHINTENLTLWDCWTICN